MPISFLTSPLPCFKVKVKDRSQDQRSGSNSWVKVKGQGQISDASKSNKCNKGVWESVIRGRKQITEWMQSIEY